MYPETLDLRGYQNESVPNTFFRQKQPSQHLAIVFPGMGYNGSMPVLYYPTLLMQSKGADVLRVDYNYMRPEYQALSKEEQDRCFQADVFAAYQTALAQGSYSQVTLIGKSIGTLALGYLLDTVPGLLAHCVWLTPLLRNRQLHRQICEYKQPSLFVIGSADPHYDQDLLSAVEAATGGQSVVVAGADHGLEVEGNIIAAIQAQARIIAAIERFLDAT